MDRTPEKPPVADRSGSARPLWQATAACLLGGAVAFVLYPGVGPTLARDAAVSIRLVTLADATAEVLTTAGLDAPRRVIEDFTTRLSGQGYTP